jgi:hypothetical protein
MDNLTDNIEQIMQILRQFWRTDKRYYQCFNATRGSNSFTVFIIER